MRRGLWTDIRTSLFDFFMSSSGTLASPPVLLGIGDDDPNDLPTFKRNCLLFNLSFVYHLILFNFS
jgi:hypothetical protein